MHSTIIQLMPLYRIAESDAATENDFENENDKMDYCRLLTDKEREERIKDVIDNSVWSKRLFTLVQGYTDRIMYNGKVEELNQEWTEDIQKQLNKLKNTKSFEPFYLSNAIRYPTGTYTLFYIQDWSAPMYPCEFFDYLSTQANKGDVFYISSVLDYHF